ncbi:MAG: DUF58 domain-containing protein, partial [Bdellovibrionales bacterium]|nr:DUF58 domain-containing protein [Bdellovibrionales bacterium]
PLRLMGQKHDLVSVIVNVPLELEFPDLGLVDIQDSETGEIITVDSSSKAFRQYFKENLRKNKEERDKNLRRTQVDKIEVNTVEDFSTPLIGFFKRRNKAR